MPDRTTTAFLTLMKVPAGFHEVRGYLEPMNYKGNKILASRGSCKHEKCPWNNTYANRGGLINGIWQHRRQHILELRRQRLTKVHNHDRRWIEHDLIRAADRLTHTEEDWLISVRACLDAWNLHIVEVDQYAPRLMTFYNVGLLASQAADRIMEIEASKVMAPIPS
jgi:alpha-L-arabinofuranosidase